jgi:hypothetical protein
MGVIMLDAVQMEIQFPLSVKRDFTDRCKEYAQDWLPENGEVYRLFESAAKSVAENRDHYGARSIVEKLRFDFAVREANSSFKINNNTCGLLSRHFTLNNPEYRGFFKERTMLGEPADPIVSQAILKNALGAV